MRSFFKCLAALGILAALAGCATNPITGRSQFMVISEKMAIGESAAAYGSMMGSLSKKNKIEADSERAQKVREITDRLIAQAVRFRPESAAWKWEVQLINDPKTVNAFCMAGGKMAIYSGMWETLKATDDEIAHVMGHEIGHALASHTQERMSIAMTSQVAAQIAAIALAPARTRAWRSPARRWPRCSPSSCRTAARASSKPTRSASSSPRAPATTRRLP
jgi:Zn-dependent protease with chaperone function